MLQVETAKKKKPKSDIRPNLLVSDFYFFFLENRVQDK